MTVTDSPNLLLLEDEHAIAETIVYAFQTDGFQVEHVDTCEKALHKIKEKEYDFAIFDVGLPDGTGFDLCKEVRTFSELPVLFLTARSDEIDRVVGLEIGGDDYVTKPFSPRELVARVKAILRRTHHEKPVEEKVVATSSSGLSLNEESCLFSYDDTPIELTKAEFSLLVTLFKHPGRVFSRDQLLDRISVDPGSAMDRVIDAHIKAIRAKLGVLSAEGKDLIETRRGLGYAFSSKGSV